MTVVIDASEAEVLEWMFTQSFDHAFARPAGIELAARHLIEKILKLLV